MASEVRGTFVNYYEVLGVAENVTTSAIQVALTTYRESLEAKINNPLTMGSARAAMSEIVPAIEHTLLSDNSIRAEYDRQLAESRRRQSEHFEPAEGEGLDDALRIPFLFNPFDDFDTEYPAFTLRLIAMKLDAEWGQARTWITDTSDETHGFISYLTFVANRKRLAERVEDIFKKVTQPVDQRMDTNEGIERCIDLLDPRIERPRVGIRNMTFDGKTFDAGTFISDLPASTELILGNEGVRGCAFGYIESRTDWVTFDRGQSQVRFALMPEGTEPAIGPSEVKIPLHFKVDNLERNSSHRALLVIHMENQVQEIEQPVPVTIFVPPLPPRVSFEPEASDKNPVWAGITLRGVATNVDVMPRNSGDEELVPLSGRISTKDSAARANPRQFRANEPITLSVDTRNRAIGQKYTIPFTIEYLTPEARGPEEIYLQGETLPTVWQSLRRVKAVEGRLGVGCGVGFAGLLLIGGFGAGLSAHAGLAWVFFLLIPIAFVLATRSIAATMVVHMHRAGNAQASTAHIAPWQFWGIPIASGVVLALVCLFIPDAGSAFWIGGLVGCIVGLVWGFVFDSARSENTGSGTAVPPTS